MDPDSEDNAGLQAGAQVGSPGAATSNVQGTSVLEIAYTTDDKTGSQAENRGRQSSNPQVENDLRATEIAYTELDKDQQKQMEE